MDGQTDVLGYREIENQLKRKFKNQPTKDRKDEIGKKLVNKKQKKGNYVLSIIKLEGRIKGQKEGK